MKARFGAWLRSNSERYLLEAAQRDIAHRYLDDARQPGPAEGAFFWRRVFVPAYRRVPWRVRKRVIGMLPGSHRKTWTGRSPP
jgi:hypothetical protein